MRRRFGGVCVCPKAARGARTRVQSRDDLGRAIPTRSTRWSRGRRAILRVPGQQSGVCSAILRAEQHAPGRTRVGRRYCTQASRDVPPTCSGHHLPSNAGRLSLLALCRMGGGPARRNLCSGRLRMNAAARAGRHATCVAARCTEGPITGAEHPAGPGMLGQRLGADQHRRQLVHGQPLDLYVPLLVANPARALSSTAPAPSSPTAG